MCGVRGSGGMQPLPEQRGGFVLSPPPPSLLQQTSDEAFPSTMNGVSSSTPNTMTFDSQAGLYFVKLLLQFIAYEFKFFDYYVLVY